jgi:prepilin-type N-terminal cleavage/methylation domain
MLAPAPISSRAVVGSRPARRGFTLIELLTVIAIIGILAAIIVPVVGSVRQTARRAACASNLRQIAAASLLYMQENNNKLPLVLGPESWGQERRWAPRLQRYLNPAVAAKSLDSQSVFRCGADDVERVSSVANESTPCSYGLNIRVHVAGNVNNTREKSFSLIANPSRLALFGEAWYSANTVFQSHSLQQFMGDFHGRGSNYAFADGHVEFLSRAVVEEIDPATSRPRLLHIPD